MADRQRYTKKVGNLLSVVVREGDVAVVVMVDSDSMFTPIDVHFAAARGSCQGCVYLDGRNCDLRWANIFNIAESKAELLRAGLRYTTDLPAAVWVILDRTLDSELEALKRFAS